MVVVERRSKGGGVRLDRVDCSPRSIASNIFWLWGGQGLSLLLGVAYGVALARLAGPSLFGDYVYVSSLVALVSPVVTFGSSQVVVRELSKRPNEITALSRQVMLLFLVLAAGAVLLLLPASRLLSRDESIRLSLCILALSLIGQGIPGAVKLAFIAWERMEYNAMISIVEKILPVLIVIPIAAMGGRLVTIVAGVTINSFLISGVAYLFFRRASGRTGFGCDIRWWGYVLRQSWPLFANALLWAGFDRADVVILRSARGPGALGMYRAVYQILVMIPLFLTNVTMALGPSIYRSAVDDRESHERQFEALVKWTFVAFTWLAILLSVGAEPATRIVLGSEFSPAATAMRILAWCLPFMAFSYTIGSFFVAGDKQIYWMYIAATGLITNVAANLILTYRLGLVGASISEVISLAVYSGVAVFLAWRGLDLRLELKNKVALGLLSAALSGAAITLFRNLPWLGLVAASAGFWALVFGLRVVRVADLRALKAMVKHV